MQAKAEEKAAKEAQKKQFTVQKKTEKTSLMTILPIKLALKSSIETNTIAQPINVVRKEEGSKMTTAAGWEIKLLQRYKM